MYLKSLNLCNYRCFEKFHIDFDEDLTVIVGSNGAGKTSALEAAAVALGTIFTSMDGLTGRNITSSDAYRKSFLVGSSEDMQTQYPVEVEADAVIDRSSVHWKRSLTNSEGKTTVVDAKEIRAVGAELQTKLRDGDKKVRLPMIAYYATNRLWDYHREKKSDVFRTNTRTNGYIDCLSGTTNLKLMLNWFRKITVQKYQRQERGLEPIPEHLAVYKAMECCFTEMADCSDVYVYYNIDSNELNVEYTEKNGLRKSEPFSILSDGYKSTISLVADIAYRMAILNPQLLDTILSETRGVIMIDEIDLHLHPRWQQKVLTVLRKIFPKIQFIVTTHAPAVINSVKTKNLRILKDYELIPAGSEVYGKEAGAVLSEIMGASSRPVYVEEKLDLFKQFLNVGELDEAEKVLDELDELRNYHDPELAGNRVKLKMERIRRGKA